jgi:outer membrane lipoprotein SlyB
MLFSISQSTYKKINSSGVVLSILSLSLLMIGGCVMTTTGDKYRATSYRAAQVNQKQAADVIEIIAILPAQVEVDNSEAQKNRQILGALLGAAGGAAIGNAVGGSNTAAGGLLGGAAGAVVASTTENTVLVEGVTITFVQDAKTYSSSQVGRTCEFKPGRAIMISMRADETRIQPNNSCAE